MTTIHLSTIGKIKLCFHTVSLVEILPYRIGNNRSEWRLLGGFRIFQLWEVASSIRITFDFLRNALAIHRS